SLSVPGQFTLGLSASNGDLDSTMCGVIGPQEFRASGGLGTGVHLEFRNADAEPTACVLPGTAREALTMGPIVIGAQAAPAADTGTAQGLLDGIRRLVILALISGLLFVFAPGLA